MKFTYSLTNDILQGNIIYRNSEYSIDFVDYSIDEVTISTGNKGCFSLAIDTLQLEVGLETKKILYPWGYFPLINYISSRINMPNFLHGNIYVDFNEPDLANGIAYEIPKSNEWKIFKDIYTDWICVCDDKNLNNNSITYIEFVQNAVLGIKNNNIVAFLIKPEIKA